MSMMMNTRVVNAPPVPQFVKDVHDRNGWAKMEFKATDDQVNQIEKYVADRVAAEHPGNVVDDEGQLRAVHGYSPGWNPSLMNSLASRALSFLGCDSVYVYQFRVNIKTPSKTAGSWSLHRDFDFWHGMDGMPTTDAVAFHILVSEHTDTNGPVVFVDGSHQVPVDPDAKDSKDWKAGFGESTLKYTLPESLIGSQPCTAMTGSRGTVASMHPLTWHYSSPNLETSNRVLFSVIFNNTANLPVQPEDTIPRPEYIVSQPMEHNIWKREPAILQRRRPNFNGWDVDHTTGAGVADQTAVENTTSAQF
jgi:ectoine hydroxylase